MSNKPPIHNMPHFGLLPARLQEEFRQNGYLVFRNAFPTPDINRLRKRIDLIVREYEPGDDLVALAPSRQDSQAAEDRLRAAAGKISCFFEKGAIDEDGQLIKPKHLAIAKIGHAMHDLDSEFSDFFRREELLSLAVVLGQDKPRLLQSMCIFKQPHIGGEVVPHQDSAFLYTEPESTLGFWIALEDARLDNGCLLAAPGGHRGPLRSRFRDIGGRLQMEELDPTPLPDCTLPLPVPAGTLIVLHGRLPHASSPNTSRSSRLAATLHVIDGACSYPQDNWLQRPADMPLRGFAKPKAAKAA